MDKIERIYNLKIIKSNDRLEVYKYQLPQREGTQGNNRNGKKGNSGNGALDKKTKEINRKKVLYRARNKIIRLICCNPMSTFITLTYKDIPKDLKQSKEHLKRFFKKLQQDFKELKYLYVLEFGSLNSRIHYHVLCNIDLPKEIDFANSKEKKIEKHKSFENKFNEKYWNRGFIDIRNLDQEGITNISKYVACYLVEDLLKLDLNCSKCYGYSKNLDKPLEEKLETKDNIDDLIQLSQYELKFINSYQIRYINKFHQEVNSTVNYFDYIKKNDD
ncbi:MAG: rolling circle replication-associated protein [Sarcina sp.]